MNRTYPAWMTHPAFQPATICGPKDTTSATPARFPPVLVHDEDQEQEYIAKGYTPVERVDPSYFLPRVNAQPLYEPVQYPMWVQGLLVKDETEHRMIAPEDFAAPDFGG